MDYTRANGAARFISRARTLMLMHAVNAGSGYFYDASRSVDGSTIETVYRGLLAHFAESRYV